MYRQLSTNVWNVGAIDWDRRIFDQLVSIPFGTTYNSYLIKGSEKTAIIDSVDPEKWNHLVTELAFHSVNSIDYIVCQHAEQDHSGSIPFLLEKFPQAIVVTNEKCKGFLQDLMPIPEDKFMVITENDTLSLGDKTLRFYFTPWVHWPETMVSFLEEDNILFSCDFFGAHIATSDLVSNNPVEYIRPAKHYFAEIMMPFRAIIRKNLAKLSSLPIKTIAPSHGPSYTDPKPIIEAYHTWCSEDTKPFVVIAYVSMHHSTKIMVDYVADQLMQKGLKVKIYNLPDSEIGDLAADLIDASSLLLAGPTVLAGAHPDIIYAAFLANALRPPTKYVSVMGSYGWGGKMLDQIKNTIPLLKAELLEPALIKGIPKESDFKQLDTLVQAFVEKNR